jgi:UDP-glucose 4-epimerase
VFNVGTGVETTIADLHTLCERAVGVDAPPSFGPPRAGDALRSVLDTSAATRDLGFSAVVPLSEGIVATHAGSGKE